MTNPTQSIDVLVEKVTRLVLDIEGMREEIRTVTVGLGKIPVIEHEVASLGKSMAGAFKAIDEAELRILANSNAIIEGRTMYRVLSVICGLSVSVAMGFTGWAWGQLASLQKVDQDLGVRIVTLEVRSVSNTNAIQRQQSNSNEQTERLTKNGWVRDAK